MTEGNLDTWHELEKKVLNDYKQFQELVEELWQEFNGTESTDMVSFMRVLEPVDYLAIKNGEELGDRRMATLIKKSGVDDTTAMRTLSLLDRWRRIPTEESLKAAGIKVQRSPNGLIQLMRGGVRSPLGRGENVKAGNNERGSDSGSSE